MRFTAPQWAVLSLNVLAMPVGIAIYLWSERCRCEGLIANMPVGVHQQRRWRWR